MTSLKLPPPLPGCGTGGEQIGGMWTPDTFSPSSTYVKLINEGGIGIRSTGDINRSRQFSLDLACPIEAHYVVINGSQKNCSALVYESYWFSTNDIIYKWKSQPTLSDQAKTTIRKVVTSVKTTELAVGKFSKVESVFTAETGITPSVLNFLFKQAIGGQ